MRYIKLTFQYMANKNFWKIVLLTLIPSVLISLFASFSSTVTYLVNFFKHDDYGFLSVYHSISDINWQGALIALGVLIVFSCILCVITGTLQRHMRTGRFAITNILKRINENFIASFLTLAVVFLLVYLFGVFTSITISAWYKITSNAVVTLVVSAIFIILIFFVMMLLVSIFSMMNPNMICTGAKVLDSISVSIKATRPHLFQLTFAFTYPLIILFGVQFGLAFVNLKFVHVIIDSIMMLFISCYYPVLTFASYYDIFDRDREDLLPENRL